MTIVGAGFLSNLGNTSDITQSQGPFCFIVSHGNLIVFVNYDTQITVAHVPFTVMKVAQPPL